MQSQRHEETSLRRDGYLRMSKRSWSPRKMDGGRRSISLERRIHFDDGSRRIRSRSPPYMEVERRRPLFYEDERRSRYEFFHHMDMKHDDVPARNGNGNEFGYGYGSSLRDEGRRFDSGIHESSSQKPAISGLYKSASLNIGLGQLGKERVYHPDVRSFTSMKQHYGDEDKYMGHLRDNGYPDLVVKESSHFARTSPRIDHLPFSRYEQRHRLDLQRHRDLDMEERFSPPRTESFRFQRERDDYRYPSDEKRGRDILKPNLVTQRGETSDMVYRNMSSRSSVERIPLTAIGGIHSRIGRKVSREDDRLDPRSHNERMTRFLYEREATANMEGYDDGRYLKRKYTIEDEENRRRSLDTSNNQDEDRRTQKVYDVHHMKYGKRANNRWKNEEIRNDDTKEVVNNYFLSFMKKLNENPGVRRKYLEQGRAGSLFCIVCGRSLSKEFLDTQRLAMHAFMSHKSGLRAQHLGLLKAICVMLGWNTLIPADTHRWFPEILSDTQTLAQKQDLIIWPPLVIVHTPYGDAEGPTTVEALGEYLRGRGLSGGKVKPGKPGIMLVKFLGTFSGLQDAEKIHEYFSNKKRGRKQFREGEGEVLFGYMGIAEDLDKLDIDTKRKCSIKSNKEIQQIAHAPVKPPTH